MRDEKNLRVQLKYWRKRRGYAIEKLAKDAHVSTVTITRIESKGLMPRPDVIDRLCAALNVTVEELIVDASDEEESHAA